MLPPSCTLSAVPLRSDSAPPFSDGEIEAAAQQDALERMEELRSSLLRTLEILHAAQALFELKPDATRSEFARFVGSALGRMPELHAIEWIPRVGARERDAWESAARAEGLVDFCFKDRDDSGALRPAGERDEYWPVAYVEPTAANLPVLGFDLRSDPSRREALERAAASGLPTATSPLPLAQLGERRLGFLVVLAVRAPGEADGSSGAAAVPASASTAAGWVLAVFRIQSFVERIFAPLIGRGLRVEICDLDDAATPPFSAGDAPAPGASAKWRYARDMPIAGRVWRFTFTPGPRFRAADPDWLRRAAKILQGTNETLEKRVAERTAELAARGAALERANAELRAEAARREAAEAALARADAQLSLLTEAETRQWALAGLVGRSARFGQMLRDVRAVQGAARTTVLLTGESGTGKELTARAIHYGGAQATSPFVRVDCAALPADQAEALLFGQARGGGPGAAAERRGYCELAEGGTLFFDEIGDLPPGLQARLLRVLEDGAYLPLGAHAPRTMNARVIAATHADLPALIAAGKFRQDLYYRLMHYHIEVPALRDRIEDVPALAQYFVRRLSAELKRVAPRLRPEALQRLLAHGYPGNVRELKNTLERAIIYAGRDELGAEHIVFAPGAAGPAGSGGDAPPPAGGVGGAGELGRKFLSDLPLNLSEAEDILIARAIAVAEGNMSKAARLLGINRASLYRWQDRRAAAAAA
jgi:DNA-binding NtrC family response regulator/CHASE1-domain containing sensor protein